MKPCSEKKIIVPIIKNLKVFYNLRLLIDTLVAANFKNFDIILGMYHDQVLILKTLFKFKGINFTLGLIIGYLRIMVPQKILLEKKLLTHQA